MTTKFSSLFVREKKNHRGGQLAASPVYTRLERDRLLVRRECVRRLGIGE